MILRERRRHFFINKPLQLRYMFTLTVIVLALLGVSLIGIYFGVWGEVLESFSDERIQSDLLTASRLQEYEEARLPRVPSSETFSMLSFFRQAERLSERQQEVFQDILNQTNRNLLGKLLPLLILVAGGTIFLSHKIAGPLYRFENVLYQITQGDLSVRCQLRKFDEAKPVAHALNLALTSLDDRLSRLKRIAKENEQNPERLASVLGEELSNFKTSADR